RREYGFQESGSWKVRRRSHTVYKTDSAYLSAYLRSVVIETYVYDAQLDTNDSNDVLIAKRTFSIDDYASMSGMEDYGGAAAPPGHLSSYGTSVTVRGNTTGVTEYTDIVAGTSTTYLSKFDIFGNVVTQQASCCNVEAISYSDTNGYALAESIVKGPSGGP